MVSLINCPNCGRANVSSEGICPNCKSDIRLLLSQRAAAEKEIERKKKVQKLEQKAIREQRQYKYICSLCKSVCVFLCRDSYDSNGNKIGDKWLYDNEILNSDYGQIGYSINCKSCGHIITTLCIRHIKNYNLIPIHECSKCEEARAKYKRIKEAEEAEELRWNRNSESSSDSKSESYASSWYNPASDSYMQDTAMF